jgi:hypothetical protein
MILRLKTPGRPDIQKEQLATIGFFYASFILPFAMLLNEIGRSPAGLVVKIRTLVYNGICSRGHKWYFNS